MKLSSWLVGSLVLAASAAQAVPIVGLINTGVGASGTVDTNYKFTVVAGDAVGTACPGGTCGVVTADPGFPLNAWLPNFASPASKWLTPTINQGQSYDAVNPGQYNWTLTFDLTGFDHTTASFNGRFLSDNESIVNLNINSVGVSSANSFTDWATFSAGSSFFQAGVNTVVFSVTNSVQPTGNPTGLRVEFLDSSVSPVPEPEGYALALAGMAAVMVAMRRRSVKK